MMMTIATAIVTLYSVSLPAVWDYVTFMKVQRTSYLQIRYDWLYSIYVIFAVALLLAAWCLLKIPSNALASTGSVNPFRMFYAVREDRVFRATLISWMFMGFANLMMLPVGWAARRPLAARQPAARDPAGAGHSGSRRPDRCASPAGAPGPRCNGCARPARRRSPCGF